MEDSDKVVEAVLAARHAAEEADIDSEYAALKKLMVDDAITKLHEKYGRRASDLTKKHEQQLKDLEVGGSLMFHPFDDCLCNNTCICIL